MHQVSLLLPSDGAEAIRYSLVEDFSDNRTNCSTKGTTACPPAALNVGGVEGLVEPRGLRCVRGRADVTSACQQIVEDVIGLVWIESKGESFCKRIRLTR